jgi:hypothetical protein
VDTTPVNVTFRIILFPVSATYNELSADLYTRDARYDYLYSEQSLQKIKGKVESMADNAEVTFVAANNHPHGQAAANAIELKSLLSDEKVKAPETLVKTYPVLEEFAVPESLDNLAISEDQNQTSGPKATQTSREKKGQTTRGATGLAVVTDQGTKQNAADITKFPFGLLRPSPK